MLNTHSLTAVNAARFSEHFRQPLRSSYSFANIPQTVQYMLSVEERCGLPLDVFGSLPKHYKKVILLFVDSFGWSFFERHQDRLPFLRRVHSTGVVSKLTAQFPSTTAAHLTTIHTGKDVSQSGIYEWYIYEPLLDEIICPVVFSGARDKWPDGLLRRGLQPEVIYPQPTLYQQLQTQGIQSYVIQSLAYTETAFSNHMLTGATVIPYSEHEEALARLTEYVTADVNERAYYFFYTGLIDHVSHYQGPHSAALDREITDFFALLEQVFQKQLYENAQETACIVIADHGQVAVDPQTTYYLNKELPNIEKYLYKTRKGELLVPAGSARDMFLYVQDEAMDQALALLRHALRGRAEVYQTKELLANGIFGEGLPSPYFQRRIGNVVILPYPYETVWWYEKDVFTMPFIGHHGGLTPDEMDIPFLLLSLGS